MDIVATFDDDWDDEPAVARLSISVAIEHSDREAAAALIEQTVIDVVGDNEVEWTASDWTARPLPSRGR